MKSVCVLGNGQLGRMLRQAGEPLGIAVYPVGLDQLPTDVPYQQSVITAEIERWPTTPFTQVLAKHDAFVNRDVFPIIADRLTQKQLFDDLALATAPWLPLTDTSDWLKCGQQLGPTQIVKRRQGGYDGRGQWRLQHIDDTKQIPLDVYGQAIVEQAIAFTGEVSLIGARNRHGVSVFYPLTHNLHQNGILQMSVMHPNVSSELQQQAEKMLTAILNRLDYVGVMAMECFVVDGGLLINELAPRVHNSGHWTQNAASISQFELHLRAILDLPLPVPDVFAPAVMVNLIGIDYNLAWLQNELVHLHWYEKQVRAGRKVGHLNLTHSHITTLTKHLLALAPLLPEQYQTGVTWAQTQLQHYI